jgi:hypothetical protein
MADDTDRTWERSPDALVARFAAMLEGFPAAERRRMFGYPAAFIGGNLATALHGPRWVVRLGADDLAAAGAIGATPFEPMPGRQMRGWLVLPTSVVEADAALAGWIERSLAFAASLPPKESRRRP